MGLLDKTFRSWGKSFGFFEKYNFTPSDQLTHEDRFWKIIQATKDRADDDFE